MVTTPSANNGKNSSNGKAASPELSNVTVSANNPLLTIEERIKLFKKLEALHQKREKLKESLDKIAGFSISPTGGELMKISDNSGTTLTFAHPIVIGELVAVAKAKFEALLKEVEAEFIF